MAEEGRRPAGWGRIAIRNPQDFYGGLVLIGVAILGFWALRRLPGQHGFAFGPGTAPRLFAGMLAGCGVLIALLGLVADGPKVERYAIRGPLLVTASVIHVCADDPAVRTCRSRPFSPSWFRRSGSAETRWQEILLLGGGAHRCSAFCCSLTRSACRFRSGRVSSCSPATDMIDLLANLALGFGVAFSPINLGLCLIGALVGTLIGVLPGIGPLATIAMLLPITFGLPPVGALIMLAGIYYGAQYGGSTTSILVNIPGEASSVITTLDGHQMARQGRAGAGARDRRDRLVLRRLRRDRAGRGARRAADRASRCCSARRSISR